MRRLLRDNGLSLVFGLLFFAALVGQAVAGHLEFNDQLSVDDLPTISFWRYLTSSAFAVDTAENWQSEYLQFFLYIFVTVWFVQRGSPESKVPDRTGMGSNSDQQVGAYVTPRSPRPARAGGWRSALYSHSLGLVMAALFVLSWLAQAVAGASAYNEQRLRDLRPPVSWPSYVGSSEFWSRTLQNWQSEFLAIASMVILAIYLRQRGSPESKPVATEHDTTGDESR